MERVFDFTAEMWIPKTPALRPLKVALIGLGIVGASFGMKVAFEGLNAHFDGIAVSEDARLRKLEWDRIAQFEDYGHASTISKESIDDVWGTPQWERPTDWERKATR
jgi:hypothetical protein